MDRSIIGAGPAWDGWLGTPAGGYALDWEQSCFDAGVADVFGYFALQCGLPRVDCLRESRIQTRIRLRSAGDRCEPDATGGDACSTVRVSVLDELPFASHSIDLVVMPHAIESSRDPHRLLREIDRVLRPEGRLLATGFNPLSLWGLRQALPTRVVAPFLPQPLKLVSAPRVKDWLGLLGFEVDAVRYGCYRPPARGRGWLDRTAFMERAGDRWWPVCGAVYCVSAVKRVHGIRLLGPAWKVPAAAATRVAAPPVRTAAPPVSDTCTRGSSATD